MRNRKGFTLVELVVAMSIAAILALAMVRIISPVYRTYRRTAERSDAQMIAGNVLDTLRGAAERANELTAVTVNGVSTILMDGGAYTVSPNGHLLFEGQEVFAPRYYNRKRISLSANPISGRTNAVYATVSVQGDEGELFSGRATLTTLKSRLTDGGAPVSPGNMYQALLAAIEAYKQTGVSFSTPEERMRMLREIYGGDFPPYGIDYIHGGLETVFEALFAAASALTGGYTNEDVAYYQTLLEDPMYLAAYLAQPATGHDPLAVIYLTDNTDHLTGANEATIQADQCRVYAIYYNGTWYFRKTPLNTDGNGGKSLRTMHQLNGMTAALFDAYMMDADKWISVPELLSQPVGP